MRGCLSRVNFPFVLFRFVSFAGALSLILYSFKYILSDFFGWPAAFLPASLTSFADFYELLL